MVVNPVLFCNVLLLQGQINICDNRPFYGTDLQNVCRVSGVRGTNLIPFPTMYPLRRFEALGVAINAVDRVNPQMGDCAVVLGCGPSAF